MGQVVTAYASQFSDLQQLVSDKLKLDNVSLTGTDATKVKEALNQTLVHVATATRYFSGSASTSALAAGANTDAIPSTIVELEYVTMTYGGQTYFLQPTTFDRILMRRVSSTTGPPVIYSLRKSTLNFWPNAQGGEVLTYYGATLPDEMTNASDTTGLPEPFATNLIVYGACVEMADFMDDPKLYFYYQNAYAQALGEFQAYLNMRVTQTSRAIPVYGPDGRPFDTAPFLPHDPSSDFFVTGFR